MGALLQFITLPLAVLALVLLISFSYRKTKALNVSPTTRQRLINVHALATEGCQLALFLIAFINTASCIETYLDMVSLGLVSNTHAATSIMLFVLASSFYHMIAIRSVDVIEAWTLLGDIGPVFNSQPCILTRSLLSSMVRKSRSGRLHQHHNLKKSPATQVLRDHAIRAALTRTRPRNLDYLDLAIPERVQRAVEIENQPPTFEKDIFYKADRSSDKHQTEELPTPPDSNQLKETKRVTWAPTVSVFSPTGVERRMSLP